MGVGFLEEEIALTERRIDRIRAKPDQTKLESNLIRYELERDRRVAQLRAVQTGKPLVGCPGSTAALFRAMGFEPVDYTGIVDRTAAGPDMVARLRDLGLPDNLCQRTTLSIPMILDGTLPRPSLLCGVGCDVGKYANSATGVLADIPCFHIDAHFGEPTEESLADVVGQIREMISFTESNIPTAKYDENKLTEIQQLDIPYYACLRDIYEMRKCLPCPESAQDVFRIPPFPAHYPEPEKVVSYMQVRRDEIAERVRTGKVPLSDEKLRFLWTNTSPYRGDMSGLLADKGVAIPFFLHGHAPRAFGINYGVYGDEAEYGRKLTPLEEVARWTIGSSWAGLASRWIRDLCQVSRELRLEGIVNLREPGCAPSIGFQKLVDDAVERELGIPSLNLEARISEYGGPQAQENKARLEIFIDLCLQRKGIA